MDDVQRQFGIVVYCDGEMETIVPEETSREDQSGRCKSVGIVQLVHKQRVLGVKNSVIEGCAAVKVVQDVVEK